MGQLPVLSSLSTRLPFFDAPLQTPHASCCKILSHSSRAVRVKFQHLFELCPCSHQARCNVCAVFFRLAIRGAPVGAKSRRGGARATKHVTFFSFFSTTNDERCDSRSLSLAVCVSLQSRRAASSPESQFSNTGCRFALRKKHVSALRLCLETPSVC